MFTRCLLLLVLTSGVTPLSLQEIYGEWNLFKMKFKRKYSTLDEENYRYNVFEENLRRIRRHNMAADRGHYSYWLGINDFADMTDAEFQQKFTGLNLKSVTKKRPMPHKLNVSYVAKEIDWRNANCVTKVKHQGVCGSCYAFAATGALESQQCIKDNGKKLVSLSEQNILDCTDNQLYDNHGCRGGQPGNAFQYVIDNGGIDTEESYPYSGEVGKCKFNKESIGATAKDYADLPVGNEAVLQEAVAGVGPIAVCIDTRGLKFYRTGVYEGVYTDSDGKQHTCSRNDVDHAMLLIGYGTEGKNYWLLKNSWGETWGINGYMKLIRNYKNTCGIATLANYPII